MKKLLLLTAAVFTLQTLPAIAEDGAKPKGPRGMHMFEMQDADKDGTVSEAEFNAFTKKKFDEIDANKDGKLTKEESSAHHEKMKAKWKERRDAHKKGGPDGAPPDAPKE